MLLVADKLVADGVIVAGPFVGELGYEIGEWIPHIKGLADRFKCRCYVFTRKGREVLYPFAEKVHTFDFPGGNAYGNWLKDPGDEERQLYNELEENVRTLAAQDEFRDRFQILQTSGRSILYKAFDDKVPLLLEAPPELRSKWEELLVSGTKVVLTYRANKRGRERNSDVEVVRQLAEFIVRKGWTPVTVGAIDDEYPVPELPGVNLISQTSLADLVAIYKLSSAVVGSSTGTIHLAAACGVPHITWGSTHSDDKVIRRYQEGWNLNGTWVRFISKDWNVSFEEIASPLIEALEVSEAASQGGNLLKSDLA